MHNEFDNANDCTKFHRCCHEMKRKKVLTWKKYIHCTQVIMDTKHSKVSWTECASVLSLMQYWKSRECHSKPDDGIWHTKENMSCIRYLVLMKGFTALKEDAMKNKTDLHAIWTHPPFIQQHFLNECLVLFFLIYGFMLALFLLLFLYYLLFYIFIPARFYNRRKQT